jgi:hypothetical protein
LTPPAEGVDGLAAAVPAVAVVVFPPAGVVVGVVSVFASANSTANADTIDKHCPIFNHFFDLNLCGGIAPDVLR